jgi:hypothetical protein
MYYPVYLVDCVADSLISNALQVATNYFHWVGGSSREFSLPSMNYTVQPAKMHSHINAQGSKMHTIWKHQNIYNA